MIWAELSRRQQLWILRWQEETVRDLLNGSCGPAITSLHPTVTRHLAPCLTSTTPIPLEAAAEIERVAGLPPGSLRPYGRVPDDDELAPPTEDGLVVLEEETTDGGPVLPAERMLALLDVTRTRGIAREALVRAANLDVTILSDIESGVRTLVGSGFVERAARSLGVGDAALLPDVESPYVLLQDVRAGRRFVLRARMGAARAEAIRAAVGTRGSVEITAARGPTDDAVAIRLDVIMDAAGTDGMIRALFAR